MISHRYFARSSDPKYTVKPITGVPERLCGRCVLQVILPEMHRLLISGAPSHKHMAHSMLYRHALSLCLRALDTAYHHARSRTCIVDRDRYLGAFSVTYYRYCNVDLEALSMQSRSTGPVNCHVAASSLCTTASSVPASRHLLKKVRIGGTLFITVLADSQHRAITTLLGLAAKIPGNSHQKRRGNTLTLLDTLFTSLHFFRKLEGCHVSLDPLLCHCRQTAPC